MNRQQWNTDLEKYPIRFYGRTWIFWACTLILGYIAVFGCIMGPLFWLDIIKPANGRPGYEAGIPVTIISSLLMPLAIASAFRVYALQWPILKIYKEGLWIRTIGTPVKVDPVLGALFGILLLIPIMLWQLVTVQMFQTRTVRLRWEDIDTKQTGNWNLVIAGRLNEANENSFDPEDWYYIAYGADSFGMPVAQVREAVFYFQNNPDSRETLPSWQDNEILFGNTSHLN